MIQYWLVVTGTMEFWMTFPSYWEFHHPNWLSQLKMIFQMGRYTTKQLSFMHMGVSENSVPLNPLVNNHYPYEKWLFHWEYTQHFQTNPYEFQGLSTLNLNSGCFSTSAIERQWFRSPGGSSNAVQPSNRSAPAKRATDKPTARSCAVTHHCGGQWDPMSSCRCTFVSHSNSGNIPI